MSDTKYWQSWRHYGNAAAHMLRFYFKMPDARIDEMSPATRAAWTACYRTVMQLTKDEEDAIRAYFGAPWTPEKQTVQPTTKTVDKVLRLVAIERGLADDR